MPAFVPVRASLAAPSLRRGGAIGLRIRQQRDRRLEVAVPALGGGAGATEGCDLARQDRHAGLALAPQHGAHRGIALGQALKQALGERKGIARYGFVLPMDEANAAVSIDLSGRPYPVFEGTFATPFIGDYRTDLTAHVIRSLAENLGAAIHVRVTGDDDHHKTEAIYKALGRALRQAIRVEGDVVPSTKGVL